MKSLSEIINEGKSSILYVYFEFGTSGWGAKPIIRISEDLKELLDRGGNSWGFHIADGRFHDDYIKRLKKKIKELKK